MTISIRRACYDKPHRCPGWAGGGFRYPKDGKTICANGYFPYTDSRFDGWKLRRCTTCGTVRLPIHLKWLDPSWLAYWVPSKIEDWKYERQWK